MWKKIKLWFIFTFLVQEVQRIRDDLYITQEDVKYTAPCVIKYKYKDKVYLYFITLSTPRVNEYPLEKSLLKVYNSDYLLFFKVIPSSILVLGNNYLTERLLVFRKIIIEGKEE